MKTKILKSIAYGIVIFVMYACSYHNNITDIQEVGRINIHKYRGYSVINKHGEYYWYISKKDTIIEIIVPDWFKNVYAVKDTIK